MPAKKQQATSGGAGGGSAATASRGKRGARDRGAFDDAALDELVRAIEGKVSKKGMTKLQARQMEEKAVAGVVNKLQGRAAPAMTAKQVQQALLAQQALQQQQQQRAAAEATYVNVCVPLPPALRAWHEVAPGRYVRYEQFSGHDADMDFIVDLFTRELSEPYSSFTYQYFVMGWPDLCIVAYGYDTTPRADAHTAAAAAAAAAVSPPPDASVVGEKVGAIVSRVTRKRAGAALRGYVAMFAVVPHFRGVRLGSRLVELTVQLMREKGCDEAYLETPTTNTRALALYLSLGFVKTKFLPRYYLDHSDAVRLKLWLTHDKLPPRDNNNDDESSRSGAVAVAGGDAGSDANDRTSAVTTAHDNERTNEAAAATAQDAVATAM